MDESFLINKNSPLLSAPKENWKTIASKCKYDRKVILVLGGRIRTEELGFTKKLSIGLIYSIRRVF